MDRLGIDFISAMGMPPDNMVRMAASLGVSSVSISPQPITENPHGYPAWNLATEPALARATKAAMADCGVRARQAEGFLIMPGMEVADSETWLDVAADMGAPTINACAIDPDRARSLDQFARLAEMAGKRGMNAMVEFMPMMIDPGNLAQALQFVADSGADNGRIMLDSMHFYRSGGQTADLAAADLSKIGYVQLCDVPMPQPGSGTPEEMMGAYGEEARHNRLCPGEGNLPLADFLAALPRDLTVGLELPMLTKAQAGISPEDALRPAVEAARRLLEGLA
jgi:sugar phosphate isomerase/epimerase